MIVNVNLINFGSTKIHVLILSLDNVNLVFSAIKQSSIKIKYKSYVKMSNYEIREALHNTQSDTLNASNA